MVILKGSLVYFQCQGHKSLNFAPIFKILVPKPISFPRPRRDVNKKIQDPQLSILKVMHKVVYTLNVSHTKNYVHHTQAHVSDTV